MGYINYEIDDQDQARKQDAVKRLDYYLDNTEPYILDYIAGAFPDSATEIHPAFFNIVKKIINLLSTCYVEPTARTIKNGTDQDSKILEIIEQTMSLNEKFKVINRYTNLLKTVLVKPTWRNEKLNLDIFTPDILDIEIGTCPEDLKKVIITHYPANENYRDLEFSVWTSASFKRLNYKKDLINSEPNPYKTIPFVVVHDRPPVHDFWCPGGDDIINAQESIYKILTDLVFTVKYQGFGIKVLKQPKSDSHPLVNYADETLTVGPNSVVTLSDKDSDFKIESPKAPITQILEMIGFIQKTTAINNGLSAGHVSMKLNRQSGTSRQVASEELREIRRSQIPTYKRAEKELFDLSKIIWNHNNPATKITPSCGLEINYPEIKLRNEITQEKKAEAWERELSMGTTSPVEILMEKDPDLSREQAKEKLDILKLERNQYMETTTNE